MRHRIELADNLAALAAIPSGSVPLVYVDPPFNTGRARVRTTLAVARAPDGGGDRTGFGGRRYASTPRARRAYADAFDDYLAFLEPRLREGHRVLAPHGSFYLHLDPRESHYVKVLMDRIFGREAFLNEIVWAYDYGGRPRRRWPAKHDTILFYVKDPANYVFNADEVEREPYMAPGLVTPEKAARGKLPSDCYSDDTDVLTERGWVRFADLRTTDRVASVSPDREIEYHRPSRLHEYRYRGPMCAFTSKTVDLLVTPNHRLFVRWKHGQTYEFVEAHRLMEPAFRGGKNRYVALMNRLTWSGEPAPGLINLPDCGYVRGYCAKPLPAFDLDDWCEFVGLYVAEGSTTVYADRNEVFIAQQKQENLEPIADLLRRMGLRFHYNGRTFVVCNKQLVHALRPLGKAHEKHLPPALLRLQRRSLERLYRGLMMGDGHRRRNEEIYCTVSKRLADDVQELLIKLGYNANIAVDPRGSDAHPNWRPIYRVSRRTSRESTIFPALHARTVDYDGMVYCCTVEPHHTLIVRRNGKPTVCGNCWWHTIVSPTGKEKTGYPTQKPLGVLKRIVAASSRPGDLVLDYFAGSGTTGAAALALGRRFHLIDDNPQAAAVMAARFAAVPDVEYVGFSPTSYQLSAIGYQPEDDEPRSE